MSYIYRDTSKVRNFNVYVPTFGNAESCPFLFAAQCFNTESVQKVTLYKVVCKHFASYQD
jgi:hypothetical protein